MEITREALNYFFNNPEDCNALYIERNDYMRANLTLEQELSDMLAKREIDAALAAQIVNTKTVWSARHYDEYGDMTIAYAATMADAVNGLYRELTQC